MAVSVVGASDRMNSLDKAARADKAIAAYGDTGTRMTIDRVTPLLVDLCHVIRREGYDVDRFITHTLHEYRQDLENDDDSPR